MNTKRIIFWACFVIILGLIVWGMIAAMNKPINGGTKLATPAPVVVTDHILGSTSTPVELIEYGDFQCPACGLYEPIVERLYNESSTTMHLVFRNFPLPQHANAMPAALVVESAGVQGKYWEMFNIVYTHQSEWSEVGDASKVFAGYAQQLKLDMTKFNASLTDPALKSKITADQAEGEKIGINQTPSFFINGKFIQNPQGYDNFKALIDAAAKSSSN